MVPFFRPELTRLLIALGLGIVTWMLVTWVQNPFREDWVAGTAQIEVSRLSPGLVEVGKPGSVRIKIRAGQDAWNRVQTSDFKASIDLSRVGAGIHSADVKVESSGEYQVVDWDPRRVTIRLDPFEQRTLPVDLQLSSKLAEGYFLRNQAVSPTQVTVSGEQQLVQSVSQIIASTTLEGARGDVSENVTPVPLDDKGQPISGLQVSPPTVRISLGIEREVGTKTVSVRITTSGQVASGFWLSAISVAPQSVTITGSPSALSGIDYIDLPAINVSGARTDVERTTKLQPSGDYSFVGAGEVTVRATITALNSTEILPVPLAIQGVGSGLEAKASPTSVDVTVAGPVPALSALKSGDISASVDASGLDKGSHQLSVRVNGPGSVSLQGSKPDKVTVTIGPPGNLTPSAAPASSSASPTITGTAPAATTPAASPPPTAAASPGPSSTSVAATPTRSS